VRDRLLEIMAHPGGHVCGIRVIFAEPFGRASQPLEGRSRVGTQRCDGHQAAKPQLSGSRDPVGQRVQFGQRAAAADLQIDWKPFGARMACAAGQTANPIAELKRRLANSPADDASKWALRWCLMDARQVREAKKLDSPAHNRELEELLRGLRARRVARREKCRARRAGRCEQELAPVYADLLRAMSAAHGAVLGAGRRLRR